MKLYLKYITATAAALSIVGAASAQTDGSGSFHGSLESNSILYRDDAATSAVAPEEGYGSNNFLKLDYYRPLFGGSLSAGIQAEWFPTPLQGFRSELKGYGLPEKYVSWSNSSLAVTVGDFYEQFGSGIVFRSWEDRALGFNNSVGGARIAFETPEAGIKLIYGFPRDYLHSGKRGSSSTESLWNNYTSTQIAGLDAAWRPFGSLLSLEGSILERMEAELPEFMRPEAIGFEIPRNNLSWSARAALNFELADAHFFTVKGEYVGKQEDYFFSPIKFEASLKGGNAQLAELNYYNLSGVSVSATFRRIDNMVNQIYHTTSTPLEANLLNYLPSLTTQHTYLLASLEPYATNAQGEQGGQIDIFYKAPKGTLLGGKRGVTFHANYAAYYTLGEYTASGKSSFMFSDLTFNIDKSWTRKWKTIFFVSVQNESPSHGAVAGDAERRIIFVADNLYKFTSRLSVRTELQYLHSKSGERDWIAGLAELNFAPRWSLFASDMYNSGDTKINYYSVGASFTHSNVRVAASYGRNRAGMVCSGGVCRWQPAYTGGNLQATIIF